MLLMEVMAIDTIDFNSTSIKNSDKLDNSRDLNEKFKEEVAEKHLRAERLF